MPNEPKSFQEAVESGIRNISFKGKDMGGQTNLEKRVTASKKPKKKTQLTAYEKAVNEYLDNNPEFEEKNPGIRKLLLDKSSPTFQLFKRPHRTSAQEDIDRAVKEDPGLKKAQRMLDNINIPEFRAYRGY